MTTQMCTSTCKSKGFKFAGTQYSRWCFCGNSYGKSGVANNCNMNCSGNKNQKCGGGWANSVYRLNKHISVWKSYFLSQELRLQ